MKHIFHCGLICVLLIFCSACGTVSGDKPLASKPKIVTSLPTAQEVPLPKQGELDTQGRLVLYCLKKSVISLNDEVGVMLIDENYDREDLPPQACYILGVQSSQKFLKTFDKQVFIDALKELPPHSEIREYDKCQVSLNTTLPQNSPLCKLDLETQLEQKKIKVAETSRLNITVTNKVNEPIFNPIVRIGIPGGATIETWQLKELVEKEKVDYYEIFHNELVLYYRGFNALEKKQIQIDFKAIIPGKYQGVASSTYLYYDNANKKWNKGVELEVVE